MAGALLSGWISRSGCPKKITTDQARQFESQLFQSLARMCGIQIARHRRLARGPTVDRGASLGSPRNSPAYKEDLQASVVELVYGEPLRITGELLTLTAEPVDLANLITEVRQHMSRLRPVPAARYASPFTFVHSELEKCTHIFLRQDTSSRALDPPYSGPYQVLPRREKTVQLLVRGKPVSVSTDRVKLAYILNGTDRGNNFNPPAATTAAAAPPATPPQPFPRTTHPGSHIHVPVSLNI
jgi:cleavage and polyadenylation specificity factor subunit 1